MKKSVLCLIFLTFVVSGYEKVFTQREDEHYLREPRNIHYLSLDPWSLSYEDGRDVKNRFTDERLSRNERKRNTRDNIPIILPEGKTITEREIETIKWVLKKDFLVNDDVAGGWWIDQFYVSIAMDSDGNFCITWEDYRNNSWYPDIYAQRYNSSGTAQGTNFRVNDDVGVNDQYNPSIAMDSDGNFCITWEDYRNNWDGDIYAQRYNASGIPQGTNFRVNDDIWGYGQNNPSIAMDSDGNFCITWGDYRNGSNDIYAQRYNASGIPQGTNFMVNDDLGTNDQYYPSIAMDSDGDFCIAWTDYRNGNTDIYAQRYNASGTPQGTNFMVNDDVGTNDQYYPSIAMDSDGDFCIAWQDYRNGTTDIYAQRYNLSGTAQGTNFRVNDDVGTYDHNSPSIAMDSNGNFCITWYDYRYSWYGDIYAQRYNSSGIPQGTNFMVNDDVGEYSQYYPSIAMDSDGNFCITWIDSRNNWNLDIYAQKYNSTGIAQGTNFLVSYDKDGNSQNNPSIAMDSDGNFCITWQDDRNGNTDIYAQRYNALGIPQGTNFKVIDDVGEYGQHYPSIAMDSNGNFCITWQDYRNWTSYIYAQRYNASGVAQGTNFMVSDGLTGYHQYNPSIAMDSDGNFCITWLDYRNSWDPDIYAQRYDASGIPQGTNFKVNDDVGANGQYYPSIAMDSDGNFCITWYDYRNGVSDIYAQRYDASGTPQGTNFKVNDDVGEYGQHLPSIAMDSDGNFCITWLDYRDSWNPDIYAQRYNSSGIPQGTNFRVNDDVGAYEQYEPSIGMSPDGDYFVITWTDYRNPDGDPEIMGQKYDNLGNPIGANVVINYDSLPYWNQMNSPRGIACNNEIIGFVWQDNRRSKGWDIYAKLTDWGLTGIEEEEKVSKLMQNYPNPFSTQTIITYWVSNDTRNITLKIFNLAGELVKTLVNNNQGLSSGGNRSKVVKMSVVWDGRDSNGKRVPSGVYFYELKTNDFKDTKKMILVK